MNKSAVGNPQTDFQYIEHPHGIYIQALEELLYAYCQERKLRPTNSISQDDAKYAVDLKHRVRKLIAK